MVKVPVGPGEAEALLGALRSLVESRTRRQQLGENARRFTLAHHGLESAAVGYLGFLEELREASEPLRVASLAFAAHELARLGIDERDRDWIDEIATALAESLVPECLGPECLGPESEPG